MLKKMQPERICEECGKLIRNRRADARKCIDCRREDQQESSRRVKAKEKEERIWNKVEVTGVKSEIEYKKIKEIVENLEKGPEEDLNVKIKEFSNPLNLTFLNVSKPPLDIFEVSRITEDIKSGEMKPFWEIIDKKVKENLEKEEIKRKEKEKKDKFRDQHHTFQ